MDAAGVIGTAAALAPSAQMKRLILLTMLAAVSACETGPTREQALASLVGRPESDALRALGAPNRVIEANGHRFLAYDDQHVGYLPAPYVGGFGFGYFGPVTYPVLRGCETTLEVAGGRVASFTLRGNAC